MTSSFTTNKQIEKPAYQDYSSDPTGWTVPINDDWDIIENDLITKQKTELQSELNRVNAEASWDLARGKGVHE